MSTIYSALEEIATQYPVNGASKETEADFSKRLERHFSRLAAQGRCLWRSQVRMMLPSLPGEPSSKAQWGRIDYVLQLDGGLPIGVEAKLGAHRASQFGDHLRQCHDYTRGIIAPQVQPDAPVSWAGKPLYGVFLACEMPMRSTDYMVRVSSLAHSLMSPFRVGFLSNNPHHGLFFSFGNTNRWWSEAGGYRTDAFARATKLGSGKRAAEVVA